MRGGATAMAGVRFHAHAVSRLGTNDTQRAAAFYDPVLAPLGMRRLREREGGLDYDTSVMVFSLEPPTDGKPASAGNGIHIAFMAECRPMADEFHRVALVHGGTDAGATGLRPEYDSHHYGAFVRDPDGYKIEAVTFASS